MFTFSLSNDRKFNTRNVNVYQLALIRGVESSLCAKWVAKDSSFLHADREDSDQTGRMPRLI